jgi:hypothetical protein
MLRPSVGQFFLVSGTHLGPLTRFLLISNSCGVLDVERALWREDRSVVYNIGWSSPVHSFSVPNPPRLMTIFFCFIFKTLKTWRARSPYLYPPGTGLPSYTTPKHWVLYSSPLTTRRAAVEVVEVKHKLQLIMLGVQQGAINSYCDEFFKSAIYWTFSETSYWYFAHIHSLLFIPANGLCCVWFTYPAFRRIWCPGTGTRTINEPVWIVFCLRTEAEPGLRNVLLNTNGKMDKVQNLKKNVMDISQSGTYKSCFFFQSFLLK